MVCGLTLVAFGLRVFRLGFQSLWFDEGWSWYVSTRSWAGMADILRTVDSHPPLYYALLKAWMALAGQSDFSLRFLSVMAGTAAIPAVYLVGRRLLGRRSMALAATLCLAFSPPHIVYSQEVRMYALAVLLTALSVYWALRWLAGPRPIVLAVYCLFTAAALYTNYFTALVVIFENVMVALWVAADWRPGPSGLTGWRRLAWWLAAQIVLGLSLLALAPLLQGVLGRNFVWRPLLNVPTMVADAWKTLTTGGSLPVWRGGLSGPAAIGLIGLGGLVVAVQGDGWRRAVSLALYLVIPVAVLVRLGEWRPIYTGRYLLPAVIPVALLAGAGVVGAGRLIVAAAVGLKRASWTALTGGALAAAGLGALGFGLPFATALRAYYYDPIYAKEDFRAVAAHIQSQEEPGQAIVLLNSGYPFLHYYTGRLNYVILPTDLDYIHDEAAVADALNQAVTGPTRVYLVGWQWDIADPQNLVESQLREHGLEVGERSWQEPGGPSSPIRVAAYDLQSSGFAPLPRLPLDVSFGDGAIHLVGYHVQGSASPGQRLSLELWWQLTAVPAQRWQVFTHLLTGPDLNTVVTQSDHVPLNDHFPFYTWKLGTPVQDLYTLEVPANAPAGLQLAVGLYDPATGQRLPVAQDGRPVGDRLFLPLK